MRPKNKVDLPPALSLPFSFRSSCRSYYFCDITTWTCSGQNDDQIGLGWVDCVDDAPVQAPIPTALRYSAVSAIEGGKGKHAASVYFIGGGLIAFAVITVASVFVVAFRTRSPVLADEAGDDLSAPLVPEPVM